MAGPFYALTGTALAVLFGVDRPLVFLYEAFSGTALFLLLPRQILPAMQIKAEPESLPPSPLQTQMARSATAFRELYDSFALQFV